MHVGSISHKPYRECAIHSQPARVDNAHWYGAVAAAGNKSTNDASHCHPCFRKTVILPTRTVALMGSWDLRPLFGMLSRTTSNLGYCRAECADAQLSSRGTARSPSPCRTKVLEQTIFVQLKQRTGDMVQHFVKDRVTWQCQTALSTFDGNRVRRQRKRVLPDGPTPPLDLPRTPNHRLDVSACDGDPLPPARHMLHCAVGSIRLWDDAKAS